MIKTEIITLGSDNFLHAELIEIIQKDKSIFLAKANAKEILEMYTVRPAQYDLEKHTELAKTFPDDAEYFKHLISQDRKNLEKEDFQRDPNEDRINKIAKFLNSEDYAFFPNAIIANCELINDWEDYDIDELNTPHDFVSLANRPKYLSFLNKQGEDYHLYIPKIPNSILVIDGQHRLEGLKKSNPDVKDHYDLVLIFIIGFDRSVIANQFTTINYEQKAVNKSLLYQLTGEFSSEVDELSFMHNVVKLLNEIPDSPFFGRVKMLGKAPKSFTKEQKALLSVSQAFLIDALIRYISATAKGSIYPPIFIKYYKDPDKHIFIVRAIARFFNAVRNIKPDWNTPGSSLLSKGMGIGALIRVFNLLFPIIFKKELENNWEMIANLKIEDYQRILSGLESIDFSTNGPYGKSGSAGNINKIKEDIIKALSYTDKPTSMPDFLAMYKQEFLQNLNAAMSSTSNG